MQAYIKVSVINSADRFIRDADLNSGKLLKTSRIIQGAITPKTKREFKDIDSTVIDGMYGSVKNRLRHLNEIHVPSQKLLVKELEILRAQHNHLELNGTALHVTTEPITLEGIEFGRFRMELYVNELGRYSTNEEVRAVAKEPNPPNNDRLITHPNVKDGYLCCGNLLSGIMSAKRDIRITDYFDLVSLLLNKFGTASPWAYIEQWIGEKCEDCGAWHSDHPSARAKSVICGGCEKTCCANCIIKPCCGKQTKRLCSTCRAKVAPYRCSNCSLWLCSECEIICEECDGKYKYCGADKYNCVAQHQAARHQNNLGAL